MVDVKVVRDQLGPQERDLVKCCGCFQREGGVSYALASDDLVEARMYIDGVICNIMCDGRI